MQCVFESIYKKSIETAFIQNTRKRGNMKNKPVKMAALISGCILLIILIFVQYFQGNGEIKASVEDDLDEGYDIVKQEMLRIEPAPGEDAEDIVVAYNIIDNEMKITVPNVTGEFDINQVDYGSPYVDKISYKSSNKKAYLTVALKDYCSYTKDIVGNKMYIYFDSLKNCKKKIIVIDPGHGGSDVGAQNGTTYEKNINLSVALKVKNILMNAGYMAVLTREGDVLPSVEKRVDFVNELSPAMFVSIHCNDSEEAEATGTEVLYNVKDNEKEYGSQWLSKLICNEVVKAAGTNNRGIVDGKSIHIIRNSRVPVALVEMGFMCNNKDVKLMSSKSGQNKFAKGITNGIIKAVERMSR